MSPPSAPRSPQAPIPTAPGAGCGAAAKRSSALGGPGRVLCPCEEVPRGQAEGDPEEAWRYRFGDSGHPSGWTARALAMAAALTGVVVDGGPRWLDAPDGRILRLPAGLRD